MSFLRNIILVFLFAFPSWAQQVISARAGLINYAEGVVYLDAERLRFPEDLFREVPRGKRVHTGLGKIEIQLGPGASLWMNEGGTLRIEDSSLTDTRLQFERGSIVVEVFEKLQDGKISIHYGDAAIELKEAGSYRLDSGRSQFRVYGGKAELRQSGRKVTVKQGRAADLANGLKTSRFDAEQTDSLQVWAAQRSRALYGLIREYRSRELASQQTEEQQRRQQQMQQARQRVEAQQRLEALRQLQEQRRRQAEQSRSAGP
jgi:hypothetical protein